MTEETKLARQILNSGAFLNAYEKRFLTNVSKQVQRFGSLTTKQSRLLNDLAHRTGNARKYKSTQIKPAAAAMMMRDLLREVKRMSSEDKKTLRIAVITQRKEGIDAVDKNALFVLFKRYCA